MSLHKDASEKFEHLDTVYIRCQVWGKPDEYGLIRVVPHGCVEFIHAEGSGVSIKVPPGELWRE